MVAIEAIRKTNADNFTNRPFVAVFVGGTQGIGRYAVEAFAGLYSTQPETSLRVYVVGRRKSSADEVLNSCRARCPHGEFTFVQAANLALIEDVDAVTTTISQLENEKPHPRIDLLVQTQAQILFGARKETKEGLDQLLSLVYYSRIRFIARLLPLLEASTHGARVISIDAAGMEANLFREDLSLRAPSHYSYRNVKSHGAYMTTMAFEHLASQHESVAFVYMSPGMVFGPSYRDPTLPWWFKMCLGVLELLLRWWVAIPPEESGQRTLFLAGRAFPPAGSKNNSVQRAKGTDGATGSGCYAVGSSCDVVEEKKHGALYPKLRNEGFQQEVWAHTMKAFEDIEVGQRFIG
ncbi:hypothetical protein M409DRAFT_29529 [Zasmidium cellare ATCC 36951]|uniref:Ketoreductase (KR) domain-containing protein n=1 Tax=Zasmidium cellare ATCC 36951 TaxID=1080233 RepID=A0A6A6C199_ZASCE|nr:uncharacterized protein M409DRAFT_29529 [Zasmidium cellare ATCC 36951]KAF2159920.1 hypothetical protein M409DRAFT_29529 [Zasmidium cellare ATCC 36951]